MYKKIRNVMKEHGTVKNVKLHVSHCFEKYHTVENY